MLAITISFTKFTSGGRTSSAGRGFGDVSARAHPRQTRRSLIRVVQPLFGESGWEAPRALSCVACSLLLLFFFLFQRLARAQMNTIPLLPTLLHLPPISLP